MFIHSITEWYSIRHHGDGGEGGESGEGGDGAPVEEEGGDGEIRHDGVHGDDHDGGHE